MTKKVIFFVITSLLPVRHEINVSKPIANKAQYLRRPLSICNGFYNLNAAEIFIKAQPVRYEFGCNYVLFNNLSQ